MSVRTTALLLAPVWIGFLGGVACGRPTDGLLVALGGYIILFGNGQPARRRLPVQVFATAGSGTRALQSTYCVAAQHRSVPEWQHLRSQVHRR
ncbi:MAG: hypothetical protein ACREU2_02430 [Steroidobacteraceae bacterium]